MIVRDAQPDDEQRWRFLWAGYNEFQGAAVPEAVTTATWRRILDPAVPLFARVAIDDAKLVGFSVCVLHEGSWVTAPICYLEDLYVEAGARGRGMGRALIEDLVALASVQGWSRLYWHADGGNVTARRLYESFVTADKFVRYRMSFDPSLPYKQSP